jgi:hypothetical protein
MVHELAPQTIGPHPVPGSPPLQSSVHCMALQSHFAPIPQANIPGLRIDASCFSLLPLAAPDALTPPEASPIGEPPAIAVAAPLLGPVVVVPPELAPLVFACPTAFAGGPPVARPFRFDEESAPLFAFSIAGPTAPSDPPVGEVDPASVAPTPDADGPVGLIDIPEAALDPTASDGGTPLSATENATSGNMHPERMASIPHTNARQ